MRKAVLRGDLSRSSEPYRPVQQLRICNRPRVQSVDSTSLLTTGEPPSPIIKTDAGRFGGPSARPGYTPYTTAGRPLDARSCRTVQCKPPPKSFGRPIGWSVTSSYEAQPTVRCRTSPTSRLGEALSRHRSAPTSSATHSTCTIVSWKTRRLHIERRMCHARMGRSALRGADLVGPTHTTDPR
jgi:hypothetical protein